MAQKSSKNVQMCSVSIAHISKEDNELLLEIATGNRAWYYGFDVITVYEKEGGFLIIIDSDIITAADLDREEILVDYGFSEAFIDLVRVSAKEGYLRMLVDEDEDSTPALPRFN